MKNISALIITVLICINSFSQARDIWAKPGKNGLFVHFGKELPKGFEYHLNRKESGGDWLLVKVCVAPQNKPEVKSRLLMAVAKNPFYGMPNDSAIGHFWRRITNSKYTDSLYFYASSPLYLEAAGVGFFDTNVKPGIKYEYQLTKVQNNTRLSEPVVIISELFPGKGHAYGAKLSAVEATGNAVKLVWGFSKINYPYGVKVYRENYLQTNPLEIRPQLIYTSRGDSIYVNITDKEVAMRMTYRYVIVPFDVFGNETPPLDAVIVLNVKPYGDAVQLKKFVAVSNEKENGISLSWSYKTKNKMNGITIFRSENFDSSFVKLADIPADDTVYTDRNLEPVKSYYYFLVFENVYGQSPPTNKIIGMLKPNKVAKMPPQWVKVVKVNEGNKVMWMKTDPDTKGYYVYRGNGYRSALSLISPLIQCDSTIVWYIDKKENLSPGISHSYAVAGMNTSFSISPLSDTAYASPWPGKLPIPLNLRAIRYGNGAMMLWEDMQNIVSGVFGYRVYRCEVNIKGEKLSEWKPICNKCETNNYVDTLIAIGTRYLYTVSSLGNSKSESEKSMAVAFFIDIPKPFPPAGLRVIPANQEIILHWDAPATIDIKEYRLYRETSNSKPALISTLKPDNTDYIDKSVEKGKTYYYKVSVVNLKGIESEKSEEVGISVQ